MPRVAQGEQGIRAANLRDELTIKSIKAYETGGTDARTDAEAIYTVAKFPDPDKREEMILRYVGLFVSIRKDIRKRIAMRSIEKGSSTDAFKDAVEQDEALADLLK